MDPDVSRVTVAAHHRQKSPRESSTVTDRAEAIAAMSQALECYLLAELHAGRLAGVIGIGGSGGTALITPAMQSAANWTAQAHGLDRSQRQHRALRGLL